MASVPVPDGAPQAFADRKALEAWYKKHHKTATELWLLLHKKASGLPSVAIEEALDIALCYGWIDAIRKPFDRTSYLQRYTPRGPRSIWSVKNRDNIERLTAEGRMTPAGHAVVDAAKADGRWDKAYHGAAKMSIPDDLLAAVEAEPAALDLFQRLNAQNRFALAFRLHNMRTAAGRARKVATFVEMLKRGETIYPNGKSK